MYSGIKSLWNYYWTPKKQSEEEKKEPAEDISEGYILVLSKDTPKEEIERLKSELNYKEVNIAGYA